MEAARLELEVDEAFRMIRRRPPRSEVEIRTLPDGLELRFPLCVVVAPLRQVHWKAVIPEIPLKGRGSRAGGRGRGSAAEARIELSATPGGTRVEPRAPGILVGIHSSSAAPPDARRDDGRVSRLTCQEGRGGQNLRE